MTFHPITVSTKTWNEVGPGKYMDSVVTFGGPSNYILLSGGKYNPKTRLTTAAASVLWQNDYVEGAVTTRFLSSAQLILTVSPGTTTSTVDSKVLTLSDLVTTAFLERLLQGEQ